MGRPRRRLWLKTQKKLGHPWVIIWQRIKRNRRRKWRGGLGGGFDIHVPDTFGQGPPEATVQNKLSEDCRHNSAECGGSDRNLQTSPRRKNGVGFPIDHSMYKEYLLGVLRVSRLGQVHHGNATKFDARTAVIAR